MEEEFSAENAFKQQVDTLQAECLQARVLQLQEENDTFRSRHDKREQETHEFVAYFQKELQARDRQISKLTEEMAALKLKHTLALENVTQTKDGVIQQMQLQLSTKEEGYQEQLREMQEELVQLERFQDVKSTIESKVKDLESQLLKEKVQGKESLEMLERKFLEEQSKLRKEHDKKMEQVRQQATEDARQGLDAETRKIMADNRRMGEELRFQLQMTDELHQEKAKLEQEHKRLVTEIDLAQSKEREYALHSQRQAREIKQLRSNLRDQEKRASSTLSDMQKEQQTAALQAERDKQEATMDADGLRRLLQLKNRELRNLRRLSQTILDQRTDVEQFFLDALAHVRKQILEERKAKREEDRKRYESEMTRANGGKTPVKFPPLRSHSTPGPKDEMKVDIRQLSWEDRERVLRLVFARINGSKSMAATAPPSPREDRIANQSSESVYYTTEPSGYLEAVTETE